MRLIFLRKGEKLPDPRRHWRVLLADLRYLGNSAYPALKAGKRWGDWTLEEVEREFARRVDALRSVGFPLLPPEEPERRRTPYWELYERVKRKGLLTQPEPKPEEVRDWLRKRRTLLGA